MNIGIIGAGCIGSSLARDIQSREIGRVLICEKNPEFLNECKDLGISSLCSDAIEDIVPDCDIIFICVPVMSIAPTILKVLPLAKKGTIVTDVGSTKQSIAEAVIPHLPGGIHFIPGHPITSGTTEIGPYAGRKGVFENARYILTPSSNTDESALDALTALLKKLGADVVKMDAEKHDALLGLTSHTSHMIAFSLMHCAAKMTNKLNENVTDFAGGSFHDMTRIAVSDSDRWRDIFLSNKKQLKQTCQMLVEEINILGTLIENNNGAELEKFIQQANLLKRESLL